jgi:hypothetical protein
MISVVARTDLSPISTLPVTWQTSRAHRILMCQALYFNMAEKETFLQLNQSCADRRGAVAPSFCLYIKQLCV